ncbi:MAG: hypothetical protein G01um101418_452 [Parcubacteria group bacterium Gr01-1014_18]|nr:MAG: hypothetical protein Greene041636_497 [Parcubacteria group bacterium Greene0416_36]TSC81039.1 MAG: hypothetical protein G01um101418_452 [Parcubacteria group bacterium Gr01-1014_18]TSC98961.1 MAG: hypothetical protein Greene101420_473 [Parcubacteria group bacterium Greene1014_20]TSD06747.1 MAG: hypothetical protein Greene07142_668 [Parcubacteria group bacterium Greene0714_2]
MLKLKGHDCAKYMMNLFNKLMGGLEKAKYALSYQKERYAVESGKKEFAAYFAERQAKK